MYTRKITPSSPPPAFCCFLLDFSCVCFWTDSEIQNLFTLYIYVFFLYNNFPLEFPNPPRIRTWTQVQRAASLPPTAPFYPSDLISMYCGWPQWLRVWVLRRLPGRTLAWVSCQGSAGRAPRWVPCVCTAWCRWGWCCWAGGAGATCCCQGPGMGVASCLGSPHGEDGEEEEVVPPPRGGRWSQRGPRAGSPAWTPGPGPERPGWAACCRCPAQRSR